MIIRTRGRARLSVVAALAIAPLALGACGGDDDGASRPTAPADATLVVEALNLKFDQREYTAAPGDHVIAYLGVDSQRHTLVVAGADDQVIGKEAVVDRGDVDTIDVALEAGTYQLICTVPGHAAAGMKATLVVG